MFRSFDEMVLLTKEKHVKARVALCCAEDSHALEAVSAARRQGIAESILLGNPEEISSILQSMGDSSANYEVIACESAEEAVAEAANLVHRGEAGAIMKGKLQTSVMMKNVLKKDNHLRESATLSVCGSFQLLHYPAGSERRVFSITDPAMNPHPDLETKRAMLENAVRLRHAMGDASPKVAVISANEVPNLKMPESLDAEQLKELNICGDIKGCLVEGPISLDLAMCPEAAQIKGYKSPVAGAADLLLMPDLISANVLAKSITEIAGGLTAGLVLGAKVPIILVSRASSSSDKFYSLTLAAFVADRY